ncbi:unextended protein-like [Galleria mellonella]|uniref:Unextended protein-like n=1 Tax=Galleria mellonella TaxID=7137 RepID=A0ABM3N0Z6_GALME|nr:unextended protein-like [Galleria mellonella]
MASMLSVLRTCGLLYCLILNVFAVDYNNPEPWILKLELLSKNCTQNKCKYLLKANGGEFLGHYSWRLTPVGGAKGGDCDVIYPNYELREVETTRWYTKLNVTVPHGSSKIYFCLHYYEKKNTPFGGKWSHQGETIFLDPKIGDAEEEKQELSQTTPDAIDGAQWGDLSHDTDVNYLSLKHKPTKTAPNDVKTKTNIHLSGLNKNLDDTSLKINRIDSKNDIEVDRSKREVLHDIFDNDDDNKLKKGEVSSFINADSNVDMNMEHNRNLFDKYLAIDEILHKDNTVVHKRKKHELNSTNLVKNNNNNKVVNCNTKVKVNSTVDDDVDDHDKEDVNKVRVQRQAMFPDINDFTNVRSAPFVIHVDGLRIEDSEKEPRITEEGLPSVLADSGVTLRLFGEGFTPRTVIAFTNHEQEYGQQCKFILKGEYMAKEDTVTRKSAVFEITAPPPITGSKLYLCVKNLKPGITDISNDEDKYIHQGTDPWKVLATHNKLLPLWATFILILICLMFSALFSGLNLGLMSLDRTELKIIANTGTEQERKYARAIMPVRDHGNYLLCSILLGNVAVNSTFTILLDELTSGLFAVIFSTLAIVLLGEITPQAICSRHGLMVGAKSIMITKAVMALTAPMAFPVSKLLDYFLGEEIGSVYNRERLKELVKVTTDVNDLDKDEVNIISGALELRKKTVSDVMTKLEDAFMLPITSILDFETMSEIIKSGYSRIPVYEGTRGNIVTVLFIKDLAFVDPDDNTPLRTLCQYYQNPCNFVFEDVTLDVMFKQFKDGHKGHMAFVHRINNEGEGDPFYETIGLVTLEDVIEEMIQAEIVDETDVFMDNRTKRRRNRPQNKLQDFAAFAERHENQRIHISPQLTLATFQFLSTSVDAFKPDTVSETVLRRLLRQDVIHHIKLKGKTKKDPSTYVFQQGKPVDYFVLILEGRVEVTVGRENLVFEAGPFTYFGVQALTQNIGVAESPTPSAMGSLQNITMDSMLRHTFVPDYSVRAIAELYYLTVKRSLYLAAKRATLMEKGALSKGATNEQFDTEVDKLLQSVDEDISISGEHKTPSRQVSPNPLPVSASPHTRSSFASRASPEPRNGDLYPGARADEQEKLLK